MNRRTFIKQTALTGITLINMPQAAFSLQNYPTEELIGKGNPPLAGEDALLRKEVYEAFIKMKTAALQENIHIKIESGYRSFQRQKTIWERKYTHYTQGGLSPEKAIQKIIEYSTIPGTSRHHWGTDMDIIDTNAPYKGDDTLNPENFVEGAPFYTLKKWLDRHADSFGFMLVYTNEPGRKGFYYEPWHYSYAPLSIPMLRAYRERINVKKMLREESILGNEHFSDTFIEKYIKEHILGINPLLLPYQ